MPLDWAHPEGPTIDVLAARTLAKSGAGTAQLWLLQGGPGGSGNVFKNAVPLLADIMPDVDFYVLEHRGVGASTRLSCPAQEDPGSTAGEGIVGPEWAPCIASLQAEWGEGLAGFTTTADAHDLDRMIQLTREPDKRAMVYGISYGTTRAMRFLQAHPGTADAVILDSIVSPGVQFLSRYDQQFDPVGQSLSALCAADPVCGQKLGADPWARVVAAREQLAAGHCPALGMTVDVIEALAPYFVMIRDIRAHMFPVVYRLDRCDPGDVQVLSHYFTTLLDMFNAPSTGPVRGSQALQMNVALSELWEEPAPSQAELAARCEAETLCPQASVTIGAQYEEWPRYAHDEYVNEWPEVTTPVLLLNGDLDPQTPIETATAAQSHFIAPHQTFVTVPFSPHGVVFESPVLTPGAPPCGAQMIAGFVADPEADVDTQCLADLAPVTWDEAPEVLDLLFGTQDMWENPQPVAGDAPPEKVDWDALAAAARRATRRLR